MDFIGVSYHFTATFYLKTPALMNSNQGYPSNIYIYTYLKNNMSQ